MFKVLFFIFFAFSLFAKEVPTLSGPVVDQANIFSNLFVSELGQNLRAFKKTTDVQLQVLTIKSLEDESLESYSIKVVDTWKLGESSTDLGLLFLISIDDRKMRIEVGQGLEGIITDILAGRLIDRAKPYFKQGDYEGGSRFVMTNIMKLINGEVDPKRIIKKSKKQGLPILPMMILLLIIFGRGGRRRSSWIYYGGSGGFSSGGGGWSGGGGGFSGGGSSGSW